MDIQNALWKLYALGDSSVLDEDYRAAFKPGPRTYRSAYFAFATVKVRK